jgi:alpha-glucosidase (family GH31 glycosyl hydrolase)
MADSQKVRIDSRLLWDNVHPILETMLASGKVDVEYPDNVKGLQTAIDVSYVLKELCHSRTNTIIEFHVADPPVRYFIGKEDEQECEVHFHPVSCYSKRFDKNYFNVQIMKEGSIPGSDCIDIEGITMYDPANVKVFEDWFLLQRLEGRVPKPFVKESGINFTHPNHHSEQLKTLLYYYSNCFAQEPGKQSISSRLNIPVSDKVYEFLCSAIEFQLKRRGVALTEYEPKETAVQSYEPETRKLKPFESAEQSYEPGWEGHQHYGNPPDEK